MYGFNNGGTIKNCYNKIDAVFNNTDTNNPSSAGICGLSENGIIRNCYNTGNITGNLKNHYTSISGICGIASNTVIENCYNTGNITGTSEFTTSGDANCRASGIANQIDTLSHISNCYNVGDIKLITKVNSDMYPVAAGILAQNRGGDLLNCYNAGKVTVEGLKTSAKPSREAGICGCNFESASEKNYINCYYLLETAEVAVGSNGSFKSIVGDSKTSNELKKLYSTLGTAFKEDINRVNNGYPILSWQ